MSKQQSQNDSPLGRLIVTGGIIWALWAYPPGAYGDPFYTNLWWFGVCVAAIGVWKSLPGLGGAGDIFRLFRAFGRDETRGSAGWMSEKDIRRAGLHRRKKGSRFIGLVAGTALWLKTETHHLILGPAGSQKSTAAIMNILMGCNESALVTDIKSELWLTTRAHREQKLGHRCVKVDPKDPENSVKINPLDQVVREVEADDPAALTRIRGMMLQLYPDPKGGGGSNDVFYKGARSLMVTTALAVVLVLSQEHRTLAMVYRALSDLDILHDLLDAASKSGALNGEVADMARALHDAAFGDGPATKTFESFRTNALLALEAFGPGNYLAAITSESTFAFSELKEKPTTLYILIDYSNSSVLGQFSGLLQWMAADAMVAAGNTKPTLFVLDEFCNAPLYTLPKILTLLRSAGVKCILATQDLDDITRVYDKHALETVLSETDIKQLLGGIKSKTTLDYISTYLGDFTETVSSFALNDGRVQESVSRTNRRLLAPNEIRELPTDAQIVLHANHKPILAKKCQVFALAPWRHQIAVNTMYSSKRYLLPVEVHVGRFWTRVTRRGRVAYGKMMRSVASQRQSRIRRVLGHLLGQSMPGGGLIVAGVLAVGLYLAGLPNLRWEYGYRETARSEPITYLWCRYVGPTAPETIRGPNCPLILWRKSW